MNQRQSQLLIGGMMGIFLAFAGITSAQAATLYLSPSSGSYTLGQTIGVVVRLNADGQAINASEGTVTWSKDKLQFVSLSAAGSIFKYWPIDPAVQGQSTAIFSGGLPSPGYRGSSGTVMRLTFRAKSAGQATVRISGAKILANDGSGTDVLSGQGAASYTISAATQPVPTPTPSVPNRPTPTVSSISHPDQSKWYREPNVTIQWTRPSGLIGASYSVTTDPNTIPDEKSDSNQTTVVVPLTADGTWYVHVRGQYAGGWSGTAHFAVHLDRLPPETFIPTISQDRGLSDPTPELQFTTTDATSGVALYTYTVDDGSATEAVSPVVLESLLPGSHRVLVVAGDRAGNEREGTVEFTTVGYTPPVIVSVSSPLILLDPLVVRGTANAGDKITVYVNNQPVGQAIAGAVDPSADTTTITPVPWALTVDKLFRPGQYEVTATATSSTGQTSVRTDPQALHITGRAFLMNGHPVAAISVITPLAITLLSILVAIVAVMTRLIMVSLIMHRRERTAEEELEILRQVNNQQGINRQQLDHALKQIEEDLEGKVPTLPQSTNRHGKRRGR